MSARWSHATEVDHPADPHYTATGKWVCHKCGLEMRLDGGKVPVTTPAKASAPKPEAPLSAQP